MVLKELEIVIKDMDDITALANETSKSKLSVDATKGRYTVDCASIMGLAALGTGSIKLKIHSADCNEYVKNITKIFS